MSRVGLLLTNIDPGDSGSAWTERWFVLHGTRLSCFHSSSDAEALLSVSVRGAKKVADYEVVDHARGLEYRHFLRVELAGAASGAVAQLLLGAPNEREQLAWIASFDAASAASASGELPAPTPAAVAQPSPPGSPMLTASSRRQAKSEWDRKRRSSLVGAPETKRGWMKLRGVMKQWVLRLFVLKPPALIYYKEEADVEKDDAIGVILLRGCVVRERTSKKDGFCFRVQSPAGHPIYASRGLQGELLASGNIRVGADDAILRVSSPEEGRSWMREIALAIDYSNKVLSSSTAAAAPALAASTAGAATATTETRPRSESASSAASPAPPTKTPVPAFLTADPNGSSTASSDVDRLFPPDPLPPQPSSKAPVPPSAPQDSPATSAAAAPIEVVTNPPQQQQQQPGLADSPQMLEGLDPPPSHYAPEPPKGEMKVDGFEQGKSMILQMAKQLRPGMDLTKVVLPTHILEPRSFLEKTTDYFAHIELISEAVREPDPVKRILKLSRWYLSGFYIMPKTPKKPYNPILGESYRCMWERGGARSFLVAEQVSHHPPISAFYAANRSEGWIVNGAILFKSKFWGMSVGSLLEGHATMYLPHLGEEYTITFPSAVAKGFIIGPLTMEMFGTVVIDCKKTGLTSSIEFKTKPAFRGDFNCIGGQIERADGQVLYTFSGRYDREVFVTDAQTKEVQSLWKVVPGMQRTPRLAIPLDEQGPFESERLWMRVTNALIDGDQETATAAKTELENAQRAGCKQREETGTKWATKLFDYHESEKQWVYKWICNHAWDPRRELFEYESGGRIFQVLRKNVPELTPAPSPGAVASTSAAAAVAIAAPTSTSPVPVVGGVFDVATVENGPLLVQELEQMREAIARLRDELQREKEANAGLAARLEATLAVVRRMSALPLVATAESAVSKRQRNDGGAAVSPTALLVFAVMLLFGVLLVFRKVAAIEARL